MFTGNLQQKKERKEIPVDWLRFPVGMAEVKTFCGACGSVCKKEEWVLFKSTFLNHGIMVVDVILNFG